MRRHSVRRHTRRTRTGRTTVGAHARNRTGRTPTGASATAIRAGIARAAFVDRWANDQEEKGRSFSGQDLMDVAPKKTSAAANRWAKTVAQRLIADNGVKDLTALYLHAVHKYGYPHDGARFGHDLGMQALGHGVGWDDDVRGAPHDAIKVPRSEFYG